MGSPEKLDSAKVPYWLNGWDRVKYSNFYSLLSLSTLTHENIYPTMTKDSADMHPIPPLRWPASRLALAEGFGSKFRASGV